MKHRIVFNGAYASFHYPPLSSSLIPACMLSVARIGLNKAPKHDTWMFAAEQRWAAGAWQMDRQRPMFHGSFLPQVYRFMSFPRQLTLSEILKMLLPAIWFPQMQWGNICIMLPSYFESIALTYRKRDTWEPITHSPNNRLQTRHIRSDENV